MFVFSCVVGSQGPNDINLTKKKQWHFSDIWWLSFQLVVHLQNVIVAINSSHLGCILKSFMTGQKLFIMPQCNFTITRIDLVANSIQPWAVLIKNKKYVLYTCLYYNTNLVLCQVTESPKILLKSIWQRKMPLFLPPLQLVYFDLSYHYLQNHHHWWSTNSCKVWRINNSYCV